MLVDRNDPRLWQRFERIAGMAHVSIEHVQAREWVVRAVPNDPSARAATFTHAELHEAMFLLVNHFTAFYGDRIRNN